jgi:nitrogen fixation protein
VVRHQFLHSFKIDKERDPMQAFMPKKALKRMKLARKDLAGYKIACKSSCWEKDAEDNDITILSMDDIRHS